MTDNEIIKALECHADPDIKTCKICPYDGGKMCGYQMCRDALDLINRQKAEIAEQTLKINQAKEDWKSLSAIIEVQKAEIERLSDRNHKCLYLSDDETTEYCVDGPCPNYVKEMVGDAE